MNRRITKDEALDILKAHKGGMGISEIARKFQRYRKTISNCIKNPQKYLEKKCAKCKESFPKTAEHFYWSATRECLNGYCKSCQAEYKKSKKRRPAGVNSFVNRYTSDLGPNDY